VCIAFGAGIAAGCGSRLGAADIQELSPPPGFAAAQQPGARRGLF